MLGIGGGLLYISGGAFVYGKSVFYGGGGYFLFIFLFLPSSGAHL